MVTLPINCDTTKSGTRLLIVDDDLSIVSALKDLLELETGHEIMTATNVNDAALIATDFCPNIALVDVKIGQANGLHLAQQLKQDHPSIICIMMTAYRNIQNTQAAILSGADDYLYKPLDPFNLVRCMEQHLRRKLNEIEKLNAENQFKGIFNQSFQCLCLLDINGMVTDVNDTAINQYGLDKQKITGLPFWQMPIWSASSEHEIAALKQRLRGSVQEAIEGRTIRLECEVKAANAKIITIDMSIKPVVNERDEVIFIITEGRDITNLKVAEQKLQHMALYDPLTELPNRKLFNIKLEEVISSSSRHKRKIAVIFIDLDRFKNVNDTLGHNIGDALLIEVAKRMLLVIRSEDTVSRLSGDEFAIIMGEINSNQSVDYVAERLLDLLNKPFLLQGQEIFISASLGIAFYPDNGNTGSELLINADMAMYKAKELGKNNYQFFDPQMNLETMERLRLETSLSQALEKNELFLEYQPKLDMVNNKIVGVEALLRWKHPELGMIPPAMFIPIAESTGMIRAIGDYVLKEACKQAKIWHSENLPLLPIAVNMSAKQFEDKNILKNISATLAETGLNPSCLVIEVTESTLMVDIDHNIAILNDLRDMGIRVAMDDFGTGYSSLSYLARLPIDTIKIDKSFISELTGNKDDTTIITAIISLAKSMQLDIIAEGVETAGQAAFLMKNDCRFMQGYLFSKPKSADDIVKLLNDLTENPLVSGL